MVKKPCIVCGTPVSGTNCKAHSRDRHLARDRLTDIYHKNHGICQLCGESTLTPGAGRQPLAPSIQHITPLALGGSDNANNLTLAHYSCNSSQGSATE